MGRVAPEPTPAVTPRMQDCLSAAVELADRLHGRATQTFEFERDQPMVPAFMLPSGTKGVSVH
jgi:hypothetical protein